MLKLKKDILKFFKEEKILGRFLYYTTTYLFIFNSPYDI